MTNPDDALLIEEIDTILGELESQDYIDWKDWREARERVRKLVIADREKQQAEKEKVIAELAVWEKELEKLGNPSKLPQGIKQLEHASIVGGIRFAYNILY